MAGGFYQGALPPNGAPGYGDRPEEEVVTEYAQVVAEGEFSLVSS